MKLRRIAIAAALLAAPLSPSAFAQLDAPLDPSTPPPAPLVEAMPLQPGPGYVWHPGYWSLDAGRYDWVAGSWMIPGYDFGLHYRVRDRIDLARHDGGGGHEGPHGGHEGGYRR